MTEFEKQAIKWANAVLSAPIGRTMNVYHPEDERVDMSLSSFQELRKLSNLVLNLGENK
jgi:hypothetical protein